MRLKQCVLAASMAVSLVLLAGCGTAGRDGASSATGSGGSSATLIVYYSYSGTTRHVAERLRDLTGGTLYELTLVNPYEGSANDVSDRVFAERDAGRMPELAGTLPDVSSYDRVLVGTPVWNESMSNPVLGYLRQTDFGGKTVAPFWTFITNEGTTREDFGREIQNAHVVDGLALRSPGGRLDSILRDWLNDIR